MGVDGVGFAVGEVDLDVGGAVDCSVPLALTSAMILLVECVALVGPVGAVLGAVGGGVGVAVAVAGEVVVFVLGATIVCSLASICLAGLAVLPGLSFPGLATVSSAATFFGRPRFFWGSGMAAMVCAPSSVVSMRIRGEESARARIQRLQERGGGEDAGEYFTP